jgi:hypothetical protein
VRDADRASPQFPIRYAERFRRIVAVLSAQLRERISGMKPAGLSILFSNRIGN